MPSGYPDFTTGVDILAQTIGNITVDIAAQTLGVLNINIASSAIALNVNIASSAITLNINIAASAIALNIKTSGGTNIVIDKLTQSAYLPRSWNLSAPPNEQNKRYVGAYGRYFPRGMRGQVYAVTMHVSNTGGGVENVIICLSPYPGGPVVGTYTYPLAPGNDQTITVYSGSLSASYWPYDSLCIYVNMATSGADVYLRAPNAAYDASCVINDGAGWYITSAYLTPWIVVYMAGAPDGDLPICGTVSAVLLPTESARYGGLWDEKAFAAKSGIDKNITAYQTGAWAAATYSNMINYVIPAGKTFYLCGVSCYSQYLAFDNTHFLHLNIRIANSTAAVDLINAGCEGGMCHSFNKPITIPTGNNLRVMVACGSSANEAVGITIWGYEV